MAVLVALGVLAVLSAAAVALALALRNKAATDAPNAVADLLDLQRYMGASLSQMGYSPYETLLGVLGSVPLTAQISQALTDGGFVRLGAADTNYRVTSTRGEMVIGNKDFLMCCACSAITNR